MLNNLYLNYNKVYFTESKLRDRVNKLLGEREKNYEINQVVQQMKTHDLNLK